MAEPVGDDDEQRPAGLSPGTRVEVRTGFDRSWASGFVVTEVIDAGYWVRRRVDDQVLPVPIGHADVRKERSSSMWWY